MTHNHPIDGLELNRGCEAHAESRGFQGEQPGTAGDFGELGGYVDDGAFSFAHTNKIVMSRVLSEKYNVMEEWMNNNKLVINPDKTHLMVIGTKKTFDLRKQVSMMAGGFPIGPTETEKLLGGDIHKSLKWNQHLADCKSSLTKQLREVGTMA